MKVVFVSNYYNHHQSEFCSELYRITAGNFTFIETDEMSSERKKMGYELNKPDYVISVNQDIVTANLCKQLINSADLVIAGGNKTVEKHIFKRIKSGKMVFRYSERIYKNQNNKKTLVLRGLKYHFNNFPYKNVLLLCSSAFAAADYSKTFNFRKRTFKWGYFPPTKQYENIDNLVDKKDKQSILWVGRFLDWKHPEVCISLAKRLKMVGLSFNIKMVGTGENYDLIQKLVEDNDLKNEISLLGVLTPNAVREQMEKSAIFIFTSDYNEGWGAVLNEAMNSACAVVASSAPGSTPFLVDDTINGLIYQNDNIEDIYNKTKKLLEDHEYQKQIGISAYNSIINVWNGKIAANRIIELYKAYSSGKDIHSLYKTGPCSSAPIIEERWYKV